MVLTPKQKDELNQAVLDYLTTAGYGQAAEVFQKEAEVEQLDIKKTGLLETKWTSVIRLQKKVMDLETKINQLQEELGSKPSRIKATGDHLPTAPEVYSLSGHRDNITAVKFHPVFNVVVSASQDATLKIWDFETGEFERTLKGHTNAVQAIDFDHTGNLMVSCSADLSIKIWDFQTDKCLRTLKDHDHNVSAVKFLPSGDQIVSASRDKTIKIWETSTGYCQKTLTGHEDWVRAIEVTDDGTLLASAGHDKTIRLWSLAKSEVIHVMREHTHYIECLAFSPASLANYQAPDGTTYKGKGVPGNFFGFWFKRQNYQDLGNCYRNLHCNSDWPR